MFSALPPKALSLATGAALLSLTACAQTTVGKAPKQADSGGAVHALVKRIQKQLVHLPGGTFEMGDWGNEEGLPYDGDANSKPLHKVTLDGFSMMVYKVTYEDFDIFTEAVGSPKINTDMEVFKPGSRKPMRPAKVNWFGAKAFCQWVGKQTGQPFDLPTEAQWEYAARSGGKRHLFATDNGNVDAGRNYPNDDYKPRLTTPEIGVYPPNQAGLYGMLDYTATEWVNDWYQPDYYKHAPTINPSGPDKGAVDERRPQFGPKKVVRGLIGSSPAFGGFTFSRAGRWPYMRDLNSVKKTDRLVTEPEAGYSNPTGPQFRCVLNSPNPFTTTSHH